MRPLVDMQRPVETGGAPGIAAFTVARLEPGEMPEGRIQLLTHRTEQMVWQPRWLAHPNGAVGLTSVIIAVGDVDEAARRFGRLTGRQPRPSSLGQTIGLDRGRVDLVTAATFLADAPASPDPVAAVHRRLRDIGRVAGDRRSASCGRAGSPTRRRGQSLIAAFPPELGCGAWLFSGPSAASADPR